MVRSEATPTAPLRQSTIRSSLKPVQGRARLFHQQGIAPERIRAKGFGETNPVASNDTMKGAPEPSRGAAPGHVMNNCSDMNKPPGSRPKGVFQGQYLLRILPCVTFRSF